MAISNQPDRVVPVNTVTGGLAGCLFRLPWKFLRNFQLDGYLQSQARNHATTHIRDRWH